MTNKKGLIVALGLLLVVGLSIAAGTFAYFQWTSGVEGGTRVNVTIEMGGIEMSIEPEATEFVGLYPTAHCENNVKYGDALVTIKNNTGTLAIPSFKLKVRVTDKDGNGVPQDALQHINYAVVPVATVMDGDNPVKDEDNTTYTCSSIPTGSDLDDAGNILFSNADEWVTHGYFENVDTTGEWSHIPTTSDKMSNDNTFADGFLPRQYYLTGDKTGNVAGITFRGESYTTTYQWYRVYVWIDEGYTSTIVGNTVSDPLQNAKIEITWSEESMVQQVSGESITEESTLEAGLYNNEGNMVKTWQQLLDAEDITISSTVITDSNKDMSGLLVIPEGITEIGEDAFFQGSLTGIKFPKSLEIIGNFAFVEVDFTSVEIPAGVTRIGSSAFEHVPLTSVTFASNSQLTSIDAYAFEGTDITSIEMPGSVESLGTAVFANCTSLNTIKFKGTTEEWNLITKGENWNLDVPATEVVCSNGVVNLK